MRSILHIDMNAFFASVEQRAAPALRGMPMAVIGSERRGIVLSPSYEARAFGVRTGMRMHEARSLCPGMVMVPADAAKYSHVCAQLIKVWERFTPRVELFSIDEAFLDVTGCDKLFGDPVRIALLIKEQTWQELGLTCSIGIGPNKLLAKLGSDMQKPDGLVLIDAEDVPIIMQDLPVRDLCGIGPHLTRRLAGMGIRTCGQLGRMPVRELASRFGVLGERLRDMGRGVDDDPVGAQEEQEAEIARSIGHSMTLDRDCEDRTEIVLHLLQLSEKVGRRMRRGGYTGRTVILTLRYADFRTFSRQIRLSRPVSHGLDIHCAAETLFEHIALEQPVRLLGVSVAGLESYMDQMPLFAEEGRRSLTAEAMDMINDRYGEFTVTWGSLAERSHHGRTISPSWRPEGARKY